MESSAHIKFVRYTLYINMLLSVSLVLFWRYFLSKIVWFTKILFYRFLNLSLAKFLTCFLFFFFFFCILCMGVLKIKFLKIKVMCILVTVTLPFLYDDIVVLYCSSEWNAAPTKTVIMMLLCYMPYNILLITTFWFIYLPLYFND